MTVSITKPEFNLREKITELDKPTGLKGNELMRSDTSQDARDLISAGRRNLFDNGACEIKQRGSSFSSAGWTADRWYMYATGGTTTIETSSPPSGFTHYLQAASATSSCIFSQGIELKNQGSAGQFKQGRIMTVSWYAKTTATGGEMMRLNASFRSASTSGTNSVSLTDPINGYNLGGGDVHITNSWARYSRTFKINVSPHSSNKILVMQIRTPSGAIGTVSLTGFQCEFGSEPTEFEHRPYSQELLLAQRYYQVHDGHYLQVVSPSTGATADFYVTLPYWVPMNHAPDVTESYTTSGATTNNLVTVTATKAKYSLRPTSANTEIYVQADTLRLDAEL